MGLDDDCELMTVIRGFRDTWLAEQEDGKALINEYYQTAPLLVSAINNSDSKAVGYKSFFQELMNIKDLIIEKRFEEAKNKYKKMVLLLKLKYLHSGGKAM